MGSSGRHIRLTKLTKEIYRVSKSLEAHPYWIATKVMEEFRRRRRRAPSIQSILKRIRKLHEEGFYETIGWKIELPIISPSVKFHLLIMGDQLRRSRLRIKKAAQELDEALSGLEELLAALY